MLLWRSPESFCRATRSPCSRDCFAHVKLMRKSSIQLLDLLAGCSPAVMHLALALRELVLTEAPEAEEVLYSVYAEVIVFRFPGRKRGAFCNIAAYSRHVNLVFYYGTELPDPHSAER